MKYYVVDLAMLINHQELFNTLQIFGQQKMEIDL